LNFFKRYIFYQNFCRYLLMSCAVGKLADVTVLHYLNQFTTSVAAANLALNGAKAAQVAANAELATTQAALIAARANTDSTQAMVPVAITAANAAAALAQQSPTPANNTATANANAAKIAADTALANAVVAENAATTTATNAAQVAATATNNVARAQVVLKRAEILVSAAGAALPFAMNVTTGQVTAGLVTLTLQLTPAANAPCQLAKVGVPNALTCMLMMFNTPGATSGNVTMTIGNVMVTMTVALPALPLM